MRLLHPKTLEVAANRDDIPKTVISHVWSEVFKWIASGKEHPKMFLKDSYDIGMYMRHVYTMGVRKGCNLNVGLLSKKGYLNIKDGWDDRRYDVAMEVFDLYFDDNYLFSDAVSLYFKGHNIFPDIFGNEWRKYVPVESIKEIKRQVDKTLSRK